MAASVCSVECAAPNPRVHTNMANRTAHPPAGKDGLHSAGKMCSVRTAHEPTETNKPAQPASLSEFAHDLCSPLSAIAMVARGLRDDDTSAERREDIDTIIRISEQALRRVRDVLDRARIEAGRDVARTETCDLNLLVADATDVSGPCARAKNLEFILRRNPSCPRYVRTDASQLQQVLINIMDNAVKYTAEGSVTLSQDFAESADPERGWLIFEIRDTGVGIARKDQARIFERFVTGSGAAGTNGSGLGLAIASQLVHSMGGSIRVKSKLGTGSSFRIELPVGRAH